MCHSSEIFSRSCFKCKAVFSFCTILHDYFFQIYFFFYAFSSTSKQHFSARTWTTDWHQVQLLPSSLFFFWILFLSLITCTWVFLPSFSQLGFELIRLHLSILSRSWLFFFFPFLPASNHHQPCGFILSWINISASESFLLTRSTSGSFQLVIIIDMKVAKWP